MIFIQKKSQYFKFEITPGLSKLVCLADFVANCVFVFFDSSLFPFQLSDLISTIGSQISFWLGMSIISGFEIVEYIVQVIMAVTSLKKNKKVQKVEGNERNATSAVKQEAS